MNRAIAAPAIFAASLLGSLWLIGTLSLAQESRVLLQHCQATSADPASCHLRIFGR